MQRAGVGQGLAGDKEIFSLVGAEAGRHLVGLVADRQALYQSLGIVETVVAQVAVGFHRQIYFLHKLRP